jgi:hypothetical protein
MRNIVLSIVVIASLVAAGIGSTFADFSDIEISQDNYFKTGSLDLRVSDYLGREYDDPDIPIFWEVSDAWPCCDKSIALDLENWGQGWQGEPWLYLHFKNFECGWVVPKNTYKWIDCDPDTGECIEVPAPDPEPAPGTQGTGLPKPVTEPEYVAECGGIAGEDADGNPVRVPGVGCCFGEDCTLADHIIITISMAGPWPHEDKPAYEDLVANDWTVIWQGPFGDLQCEEFELLQLDNCNGIWLHMSLHMFDIDEDDLGLHYFDEDSKWDHWPTNAIQKDAVHFDIAFELLQNRWPTNYP